MMGNGKIIICMDMGNCIIRIINLPMKANGLWISFMAKGKFVMISHRGFKGSLIIQIGQNWDNNGNTMKEDLFVMLSKDRAS